MKIKINICRKCQHYGSGMGQLYIFDNGYERIIYNAEYCQLQNPMGLKTSLMLDKYTKVPKECIMKLEQVVL